MRKLLLCTIGAAALLVSGATAAIPITNMLTLSDPTRGAGLCEVFCVGTITFDMICDGSIAVAADSRYIVTGLEIAITDIGS